MNPAFDPLESLSPHTWSKVIETNLSCPWHLARHALRAIAEAGDGAMAMLSSIRAFLSSRGPGAYGVSKAALDQLVRQFAVVWGERNVRINGVAAGTIRSDMIRGLTDQPGWLDAVIARAPLGRIDEPEDVAVMILFLAFDAAHQMTGQVIVVDGGETITRGRYTHVRAIAKRRSGPFRQ